MLFDTKKWKKAFFDSLLLTIITFLLSSPYFYHFIVHQPDKLSPFNSKILGLPDGAKGIFVLSQISMFLFLIFLCSFIGFAFSGKYGFKGLGNIDQVKKDFKYFFPAALLTNITVYFLFDRYMMKQIPSIYPSKAMWGFAKAIMHSTTFEIVSKFGLITVIMGIFKNRYTAVILPAIFFTVLVPNTFFDYGIEFGINFISISAISITFAYGLVSGYLYINRGLLSIMVLRLLLDLKYVLYPFIMQ